MKTAILVAGAASLLLSQSAQSRVVPAWTASEQATWGSDFLFPTTIPNVLKDRTLRQVVRLGIGGNDVRIALANIHGSRPVTVAGASLAPSAGEGRTLAIGNHVLRFSGEMAVTIAPGATILSDPVSMSVTAGQDLAVSFYFAESPSSRASIGMASALDMSSRETNWRQPHRRLQKRRRPGCCSPACWSTHRTRRAPW